MRDKRHKENKRLDVSLQGHMTIASLGVAMESALVKVGSQILKTGFNVRDRLKVFGIMELVNEDEIKTVIKHYGYTKPAKWYYEELQENMIGLLSDHIKLIIEVEKSEVKEKLRFFVKCMPRNDKWKSEYSRDFFKKEYIMLSSLFRQFEDLEGIQKWRPKLLYIREGLFIFEDVGHLGYIMSNNCDTMSYDDLKASIQALARFHAASYILEENKSKELGRPYRIWEDYSDNLQEPVTEQGWRDTGRNAIVDFLKLFSKYKHEPKVLMKAETVIHMLFDRAVNLMKPSKKYRNVVVHRDLWTNNVMIKRDPQCGPRALIIDFQTVVYASPMLDLTSLIYFNTTKRDRDEFKDFFIDLYYKCISSVLQSYDMNIEDIFNKKEIIKSFDECIAYGITQAALVVPVVSMNPEMKKAMFSDPENSIKANVVSRSEYFIEFAKGDKTYRNRVIDVFDEIVDRYIISEE